MFGGPSCSSLLTMLGIRAPGRSVCVMKVRLVSTFASLVRMSVQIVSMMSSSLRTLTSRLVGWTFTSMR